MVAAQPGWWVEFWDTAGHVDSPVGVVGEFVMPTAQCHAVSDAGGAVVGPVDNMMNFTPPGRYRTPGKSAPAVSNTDGAADRGGHGVTGASDVQWLTAGPQHHRNDLGVTGDAAGEVGVDRTTERH